MDVLSVHELEAALQSYEASIDELESIRQSDSTKAETEEVLLRHGHASHSMRIVQSGKQK